MILIFHYGSGINPSPQLFNSIKTFTFFCSFLVTCTSFTSFVKIITKYLKIFDLDRNFYNFDFVTVSDV